MRQDFAAIAHWKGGYDENALETWAAAARGQLAAPRVSLGLVFMTPGLFAHAAQVLELIRVRAQVPLLLGCSSTGLIAGPREMEDTEGIVLGLFALPGAELSVVHFTQADVDLEQESTQPQWPQRTGIAPQASRGWLAFIDPFRLDAETWLRQWNQVYATAPVLGGLASGRSSEQRTQVYLNGEVFEEGGVALSVGGALELAGVVSQGCTPIGQTWTITKAEQNLIHEIANRPAYQVLAETFQGLPPEEQQRARGNLFLGLVMDEYREEFRRGDFLIRNLIGFDPRSGTIAVGTLPRAGQTLQFQRRDPGTASEDLTTLLSQARQQLAGRHIYGGCLCCCNGRGAGLFGQPHHDASRVQELLGPIGLAGFFCNGELGPVAGRNHLHGYTASLALFVDRGGTD
jgi:small ligand-binding sensory domain FIST